MATIGIIALTAMAFGYIVVLVCFALSFVYGEAEDALIYALIGVLAVAIAFAFALMVYAIWGVGTAVSAGACV